jgi:hypothetical protein
MRAISNSPDKLMPKQPPQKHPPAAKIGRPERFGIRTAQYSKDDIRQMDAKDAPPGLS